MDLLNWSIQTSKPGDITIVISEYVLNELGVFIKQEYRVLKKNKLNAVMGFRIGYEPVPNTDYRAARGNRNAITAFNLFFFNTRYSCLTNTPSSLSTYSEITIVISSGLLV